MHQEIDPTARWDVRHHDELLENVRLEERRIAGRLMLACITERDVVAYLQMDRVSSSIRRRDS